MSSILDFNFSSFIKGKFQTSLIVLILAITGCNLADKNSRSAQVDHGIKDTLRIYDYSNMGYRFSLKLYKDSFTFIKSGIDSISGLVDYNNDDVKLDFESINNKAKSSELLKEIHGVSMVKTFQFDEIAPLMIVPTDVGIYNRMADPPKSIKSRYYRGTGYTRYFINLKNDHSLIYNEYNDKGTADTIIGNWNRNERVIYCYNLPDNCSIFQFTQNGIFFIFGEILIGRKIELVNHTIVIRCFYFVKE